MLRRLSLLSIAVLFAIIALRGQDGKPSVVATASMIADMIQEIAGDFVELECIVPIGGDPHIYDATPRDAQLVNEADLIFKNGLTFEGWLNELIENAGSAAKIITVTDGIKPIESLQYANASDPHAWMDVSLGLTYIKNIKEAIVELDPTHQETYVENYNIYRAKLEALDTYIKDQISSIPARQRILITSHDAFQYYGRRYGVRLESVLGTSTDADVQTSDIMRLNKVIQDNDVPALFIESTINPKILEQIAADQDILIGGKLYADSLGDQESPAPTYLQMLRHNTDVIVKALSGLRKKVEVESSTDQKWWLYGVIAAVCILVFMILMKRIN